MKKLENTELQKIVGGAFTATMLGNILRGASLLLDLGRSLGSAVRRIQTGKICSL